MKRTTTASRQETDEIELVFDLLTWIESNIPKNALNQYPVIDAKVYYDVFNQAKRSACSFSDYPAKKCTDRTLEIAHRKTLLHVEQ